MKSIIQCFQNVFTVIYNILRYNDTKPATLATILSGYLWAMCLFIPGNTFDGRIAYSAMSYLISNELIWAVIFVIVSSLQLYRISSSVNRHPALNLLIKFLACALWTFVSVSCFLSKWPPIALASDSILVAIAAWWAFLRKDYDK